MQFHKLILIVSFIFSPIYLGSSAAEKAIEKRISPVGQVCIEGQQCADTQITMSSPVEGMRSGKDIYEVSCKTCHSIGLAGAPSFGDRLSWGDRPDKGVEALVQSVINGLNGMPPMGLCWDCSPEEVKDSVEYMLDQLK